VFARFVAARGFAYRQQQGFYTPLYRIADFYLPEQNLTVEIDGPCHDPAKDRIKDARFLEARGIRTLRLSNEQATRIPTRRQHGERGLFRARARSAAEGAWTFRRLAHHGRMVKILERPEDQKPAMMDSSHERQSAGSSTYSAI